MKQFDVSFISGVNVAQNFSALTALLNAREKHCIDNLLWSKNGYMPEVSFRMAYTSTGILLKYLVKEKHVKAVYRQTNDPVYRDSCVEMFISFNNEASYYNLEFNSLGTALVGFGPEKNDRVCIDRQMVEGIQSHHLIKTPSNNDDALIEWELALNIPFTVFEYHNITSLNNQVCNVNFYKCGDDLPDPHFLSWNNITYPHPNFHLPEFFGKVKFIP